MTTWGRYVHPDACRGVWKMGPYVEFGVGQGQGKRKKILSIKTKQNFSSPSLGNLYFCFILDKVPNLSYLTSLETSKLLIFPPCPKMLMNKFWLLVLFLPYKAFWIVVKFLPERAWQSFSNMLTFIFGSHFMPSPPSLCLSKGSQVTIPMFFSWLQNICSQPKLKYAIFSTRNWTVFGSLLYSLQKLTVEMTGAIWYS